MLAAGNVVGPYEIRNQLGAGGMGEVFLAWDSRLRRDVAIKVLIARGESDPDRLRRFEQEARAAGALNHPNVVAVYDVGSHGGAPYIVSERLEGDTLRARISAGLAPRKAIDFAMQIARGLAAAHERGIVHRDLKPENVFVCTNGTVKILDFGIAKLLPQSNRDDDQTVSRITQAGMTVGTSAYMSPEQVRGEPVDARSDIFSLGIVLFEMLSGTRPFAGTTHAEVQTAILRDDPATLPAKAGASLSVGRLIMRCLEKRPADRFDTAKDVALALEAASGAVDDATSSAVPADRVPRFRQATLAIAGLIAGAVITAVLLEIVRAPTPPPTYTQLTFRRGTITGARFAPDGETVVYSAAWDGEPARIFTTRIGARESRELDVEGIVLDVAATGEVTMQLGALRRPGIAATLGRVSLSGGAPRPLTNDVVAAAWDRGGRELAVLRRDGIYTRLEYPIGTVWNRLSGDVGGLCTLPDGRIAISEQLADGGDKPYALTILDRTGTRRVLSTGWAEPFNLAWSPATNEIFFAASTGGLIDLYAAALNGSTRVVARVPGDFQLQDVDRRGRVLMSRSFPRGGVVVLPPNETQERDLSWLDFSGAVDISADGRHVLIADIGGGLAGIGGIALRRTDGAPAVDLGQGSPVALSADGQYVLAIPNQTDRADRLLVIPAAAGDRRELRSPALRHFFDGTFFPDRRRISIVAGDDAAHTRLYAWSVDGTVAPRALSDQGEFGRPVISHDSQWVVAARSGTLLARYPVEGGTPVPIPGALPDDQPLRWSADDRWLFVRRGNAMPARVERLEVATGKRVLWKELRPPESAGVFGITSVVITPEGHSYAYTFASSVGALYLAEGLR